MYPSRPLPSELQAVKFLSALLITATIAACGGSAEPEGKPTANAEPTTPITPTTPNVPAIASNGKLKIFILAGQSNMEGYGKVDRGGDPDRANIVCPLKADGKRNGPANILGGMGSLRAMVEKEPAKYIYLVDTSKTITYTVDANVAECVKADKKIYSSWATRNDVHVSFWDEKSRGVTVEVRNGPLSVGLGVDNQMRTGEGYIGPELGFGHMVGNGLTDKVLLIKTAWGGKSLTVDFRPPSSVGLGIGSPTVVTTPAIPDKTGVYYTEMVNKVRLVLSDIKKYYPDYDGKGFEVVGFGWHQGWNDRDNRNYVAQYGANLANLIRDIRKDLNLPNMLFVVGNSGMANAYINEGLALVTAQGSVSDPVKYPDFVGNVSVVDTRPFHFPDTSPEIGFIYHWNYNGESYFKVGESMGTAMLKLMKP
jgi:Carbohydrate esterase, sialic acid-specific acetylesterase